MVRNRVRALRVNGARAALAVLCALASGCSLLVHFEIGAPDAGDAGGLFVDSSNSDAAAGIDRAVGDDHSADTDAAAVDREPGDTGIRDGSLPDTSIRDTRMRDMSICDIGALETATVVDSAAATDANAAGEAGTDAAVSVPVCGTTSVLVEDFGDDALTYPWSPYQTNSVTVDEVRQRLEIDLVASAEPGYGGIWSDVPTRLREDSVRVHLVEAPTQNGATEAYLNFATDHANVLQIALSYGQVRSRVWIDDVKVFDRSITYAPMQHAWWRIRETDDQIYFEVSGNGLDPWNTMYSSTAPAFVDSGFIEIGAGTWDWVASPGRAVFDDLNTDRPRAPWCPVTDFSDDFSGTIIDTRWDLASQPGCLYAHAGVSLCMTLVANGSGSCEAITRDFYAYDGHPITVQITQHAASATTAMVGLELWNPAGLWVEYGYNGDQLHAYVPGAAVDWWDGRRSEEWLRIQRAGSNIEFLVGDSFGNWSTVFATALPVTDDMTDVRLAIDPSSAASNPITVCYDNYNLPP